MKCKLILFILITSQILLGCGGGDDSGNDSGTSYVGFWRSTSAAHYVEVTKDNTAYIRECTVSNGYSIAYTGKVNGNDFSLLNFVYKLSLAQDVMTITTPSTNYTREYARASSIPDVCTDDAIDVTFVSPTATTEGTSTNFIVNFDYRLASKNNGIVHLGFNVDRADLITLTNSTLEITSAETGSGSLSATISPVFYAAPDSFQLYMFLSENPQADPWIPLSSEMVSINVTKVGSSSVNNGSYKIGNHSKAVSTHCSMSLFIRCANTSK